LLFLSCFDFFFLCLLTQLVVDLEIVNFVERDAQNI
jgi:hypothetical protein